MNCTKREAARTGEQSRTENRRSRRFARVNPRNDKNQLAGFPSAARRKGQPRKLSSLQQLHDASNRYALLLIFQGIDAAGKDGAIQHIMSGVNPQGREVFSFKERGAD